MRPKSRQKTARKSKSGSKASARAKSTEQGVKSSIPTKSAKSLSLPKGVRLVMGLHSIKEALKLRPQAVQELWLRSHFQDSPELRELHQWAIDQKIKIELRSPDFLDRWTSGNQGAGVLVNESPQLNWSDLEGEGPALVLILDNIEDPHNLGAIMRTAWLLGVKAVFVPEVRSVSLTASVCKVASGGAEHVPLEIESGLPNLMERLKAAGFWIYGLAAEGSNQLWQLQLEGKVAWVIGSEERGLRKPVARACDELIRIPQLSAGASYNASVAAAIALAESARQLKTL